MGAEIDRLEVQIEAEAAKASKQLDDIVKKLGLLAEGISAIKSNKGLEDFASKAKDVSKSIQSVQSNANEMVKSIDEPLKKVSKSLRKLEDQYKDLGKDFQFFGNAQSTQKKLESLSNALETAKLNKQELEASGKTNGQMYENAVKDVIKYKNMIESLQSRIEKISKEKFSYPAPQTSKYENDITKHLRGIGAYGLLNDYIKEMEEVEQGVAKMSEKSSQAAQGIKDSFAQVSEPLKEIDLTLADFSMKVTEALSAPQEESKRFSANLLGLKDVLYGIQERFLEFKGRLENTFVSKGLKTYTSEYVELQNQITKTEKTLATLNAQMARSRETVKNFEGTTSYRKMQYDIKAAKEELQRLRKEQDRLEVSGGATKWSFKGLASDAKSLTKTLHPLQNALKKILSTINSVLSKVWKLAKSMISLGTATKKSNASFSSGLKTILKYGFGIRSLYILFNKLRNAIKEGMENLIQYSDRTNASVSMLSSSLNQLKNASAAAIAPLLNAIAPALNTLIQLFIKAANAVNQFFSALTGNGTWIKAKYVYEDVAAGISDAAKAAKGALQPFDALNNLTTQDNSVSGVNPGDMFETVPVDDKFKDLADKVKDILSKLFAPLKEAWDREGQFVMDSWKYALDEIWKLIKDIGRDFLEVWNQPETVDMLADILHIIGDIGLVVGHLARNFRETWNENKTGLHILENIRDIFAVIIANMRHAADDTVEWADKLDFSPLLEAFERFTESLIPVADSLSGILTDFYEKVLLPLGTWTIEKGLPELLDVFTAFNEKVDWESLRSNLAEFWEHLEPFAETVGEGLIIFIERVSNALADFLNSQEFKDFLVSIEEWMDKVTPEDVADTLESIAKALIALKAALFAFNGIVALNKGFKVIKDFLLFISAINGKIVMALSSIKGAISGFIQWATAGLSGISGMMNLSNFLGVFASFNPGMIGELGIKLEYLLQGTIFDSNTWTGLLGSAANAIGNVLNWFADFIGGTIMGIFSGLGELITTDFSQTFSLFEAAGEFFEKAKQAFADKDWGELGKDIVFGIIGGLLGAISFIVEPIQNFFYGFWNAICDVFGIHSPAASMYPIGEYILLGVIEGFKQKIEEFRNAVQNWYDTSVVPWFTLERWSNLYNNIKDSLISKWNEAKAEWNSSISEWWNSYVIPWFTKAKWVNAMSGIKSAFKEVWNSAISSVKEIWNKFANSLNSKLNISIPAVKVGGKTISEAMNLNLGKIPTFSTGGFPEDGLFMANRGELVGQFSNGKTAVANNEQITAGIEEAAYRGMMRAIQESGGFSPSLSVTLEERAGRFLEIVGEEYNEKANRLGVNARDPVLGW